MIEVSFLLKNEHVSFHSCTILETPYFVEEWHSKTQADARKTLPK